MSKKQPEAKLALAESFVRLVENMPTEHISVGMIAESAGKHRKTFYYHFDDKSQLIRWIFRHDLAQGLCQHFSESALLYNPDDKETVLADFAFYVRNITASGRLYNAPFFDALSHSLNQRRIYYRRIFLQSGPDSLESYLARLYTPAIKEDIRLIASNICEKEGLKINSPSRCFPEIETGIDFLADFFTGAFVSRIITRLNSSPQQRTGAEVAPFENVIHDSIEALIEQKLRNQLHDHKTATGSLSEGTPEKPDISDIAKKSHPKEKTCVYLA